MNWIPWDKDINVEYYADKEVNRFTSKRTSPKMVGNGEHLFAAHMNGVVTSDAKFDVLVDNKKYEIKSVGAFRFSYSKTYAEDVHRTYTKMINQLIHALHGIAHYGNILDRAIQINENGYLGTKAIMGKIYRDKRTKPILGLNQIVNLLYHDMAETGSPLININVDGENVTLKKYELIRLNHIIMRKDINPLDIDLIYSKLFSHRFNQKNIIEMLWNSIKPSELLFTHADHLVVVDKEKGYIIMEKETMDDYIVFTGFQKSEAQFRTLKELKDVPTKIMEYNSA